MMTWKELQTEFDALRNSLRFCRLDYQWGSAGIYYRIAGGGRNHATRRFEALANIAGLKLSELPEEVLNTQIHNTADPISKWYEALRHHSGSFDFGFAAQESGDNGESLGSIFTGSLHHPADSSALLCLQFSSIPIEPQLKIKAKNKIWLNANIPFQWLNTQFKREADDRGYLWIVLAFIITALLAIVPIWNH